MVLHHRYYKPQWSELDNCMSQCKASCCILFKSEKIRSIMIYDFFLKSQVNFNCSHLQLGDRRPNQEKLVSKKSGRTLFGLNI